MSGQRRPTPVASGDPWLEGLASEDAEDTARLRSTVGFAVIFHTVLLAVTLPQLSGPILEVDAKTKKLFVVQQVRFQRPPMPPKQAAPKKAAKKIPIPDPTPLDPEPFVADDLPVPEVEIPEGFDVVYGIPDAPPGVGKHGEYGDVMEVGGNIRAPVKIFAPEPRYTEEARRARIQGMVILRAVIDENGDVVDVEVLKDLPLGLVESAVETVKRWKYEPATLDGGPVPVYFIISVGFHLM